MLVPGSYDPRGAAPQRLSAAGSWYNPGYTEVMKTAVSLPDELFQMAEGVARRLKVSRSQLYATALADFLDRQRAGNVTGQLNAVYARQPAKVDPALHRAQLRSVGKDRW